MENMHDSKICTVMWHRLKRVYVLQFMKTYVHYYVKISVVLLLLSGELSSVQLAGQVKSSTASVGRALPTRNFLLTRHLAGAHLSIHRNTTRAGHSASHTLPLRRPRIPHRSLCIVAGATTNLKEAGSAATTH
jgi:hypothetical protein